MLPRSSSARMHKSAAAIDDWSEPSNLLPIRPFFGKRCSWLPEMHLGCCGITCAQIVVLQPIQSATAPVARPGNNATQIRRNLGSVLIAVALIGAFFLSFPPEASGAFVMLKKQGRARAPGSFSSRRRSRHAAQLTSACIMHGAIIRKKPVFYYLPLIAPPTHYRLFWRNCCSSSPLRRKRDPVLAPTFQLERQRRHSYHDCQRDAFGAPSEPWRHRSRRGGF